ncbi:MAG: FecR domain-containing protein [Cyclobacteriaceae bacterium]
MIQKVKDHLGIAGLFVKQIFGEDSNDPSKELNQWKKDHTDATEEIYNWDNFTQRQIDISQIDTKKEWDNLSRKLNKGNNVQQLIRYAAAAVIVLATGLLFYLPKLSQEEQVAETKQVVKENPKGVKSQIQLPDGTHVWLNSVSSIAYQADFSDSIRLITLKGEGYFEVVKDPERPFKVKSGDVTTTALGTAFNVNAYNENQIQVSLHEGKVGVERKKVNGTTILLPGQQAKSTDAGISVFQFNSEETLAWKDGTLYFDKTGLDEVMRTLEKWYNVSFEVENLSEAKRKELKVTGKFKDQTLVNVLKLLSHSMHFNYTIDQKNVTLNFR